MKTKIYVLGEVFANYEYAPLCHESDDTVIIAVDATGKNEWAAEVYFWSAPFDITVSNFEDIQYTIEDCFEEIHDAWSALYMAYEKSDIYGIDRLGDLCDIKDRVLENIKLHGLPDGLERQVWHIDEEDLNVTFVNSGSNWRLICRIK